MNSPATDVAVTLDRLLGGRLQLRQPARGHRAGTDAVLLAAFAQVRAGGTVVDLGAGVGTVGLILAMRDPALQVVLVERDATLAALARDNAALNGVSDRVRVEERDVFASHETSCADLVVCNPPFHPAGQTRASPHAGRAEAHHLGARDHADWLGAMLRHARPRGGFAMINRADALPFLLASGLGRLGGMVLKPVLPRADAPATRILLSGTVGGRAPFTLLPALVLHGPDHGFTPEADAAHRGSTIGAETTKPALGPASRD